MEEQQQAQIAALAEGLTELSAALTAQRFLLEQMYANAFIGNLEGFEQMLSGMIEKTRTRSTAAEPTKTEDLAEMAARTAAHLQRFQSSVALRIKQGYAK